MRRLGRVRVTSLLWLVLILACWHAVRLWTALAWYDTLLEFAPRPGPVYIALSGLAWLALGGLLAWGLWRRQAWSWLLLPWLAGGYTAWYWFDRLAFHEARSNWPFILLLNLTLLAYVAVLTLANRTTRKI
jgi:hypothetical protein